MTGIGKSPLSGFEERLLTELREVVAGKEAVARQPGTRPGTARIMRPRRLVMAAAIGTSAAVAAGLIAATAARPAAEPASGYSLAAEFLHHAAAAARATHSGSPGPGQAYYTKQLTAIPGSSFRECYVVWVIPPLTVMPPGRALVGPKCRPGIPAAPDGLNSGFFRRPAKGGRVYPSVHSLPASPAALRAELYALAPDWGMPSSYSVDQIVFSMTGWLAQMPLSGAQRAALYEVMAQLPGVRLVRNATDAAGRHGTGIAIRLQQPGYGLSTIEFIFTPGTYKFLGQMNNWPGQGPVLTADLGSGLVTMPRS